jgi:hypothetical protein
MKPFIYIGDFLAVLFFVAGIWLVWWVSGRSRKTASRVLGGISGILLLLIGLLCLLVVHSGQWATF